MYKLKLEDILRIYYRGYLQGSRGHEPMSEEKLIELIKNRNL